MLYPDGYGDRLITLDEMKARHQPRMHPEFARRFFAYIEHKQGALGVGGGFRTTQPDKPGFAPDGKSFHQLQEWASGIDGYAAVDLVAPTDGKHRSPRWDETEDAPDFGLHTFIRTPRPEPWHIQPIETRGWQTWVNEGRPDPPRFPLPATNPPPKEIPMKYYALPPADMPDNPAHIVVIDAACRYRTNADTDPLPEIRLPEEQYLQLRKSAGLD